MESFKLSAGINTVQMLATMIRSLETQIQDLQDLVKESGEIMLVIVTGKISIA